MSNHERIRRCMEERNIPETVRRSAEYCHYRQMVRVMIGVFSLIFIIALISVPFVTLKIDGELTAEGIGQTLGVLACVMIPYTLVWGGIAGWFGLKIRWLSREPEGYVFGRTVLREYHAPGFFTVDVVWEDGAASRFDTRAVFSTSLFGMPQKDDYQGKKALVGYNRQTGALIIVKED